MGAKEGDGMQTIQDAKILIVDDSRELRNLLKEELGSAGYHRLILFLNKTLQINARICYSISG